MRVGESRQQSCATTLPVPGWPGSGWYPGSVCTTTKCGVSPVIVAPDFAIEPSELPQVFREEYSAEYPKALAKLDRDWMPLTAFIDYPAEHWRHLRTTYPLIASADAVEKTDLQGACARDDRAEPRPAPRRVSSGRLG